MGCHFFPADFSAFHFVDDVGEEILPCCFTFDPTANGNREISMAFSISIRSGIESTYRVTLSRLNCEWVFRTETVTLGSKTLPIAAMIG